MVSFILVLILANEILFIYFFISHQDDISPRYADAAARQSRSRLDYEYGGSGSQYREAYDDR
jgi:hypothetical protein